MVVQPLITAYTTGREPVFINELRPLPLSEVEGRIHAIVAALRANDHPVKRVVIDLLIIRDADEVATRSAG